MLGERAGDLIGSKLIGNLNPPAQGDFMDRDDQEIVAFYQRIADATAKRHQLLDLHGAYVPAGLQRTYPNFITQEGVLGADDGSVANVARASRISFSTVPQHAVVIGRYAGLHVFDNKWRQKKRGLAINHVLASDIDNKCICVRFQLRVYMY